MYLVELFSATEWGPYVSIRDLSELSYLIVWA